MSDTHLFLIVGAGVLAVLAEHAALVAIGYLASRRALHEAVEDIRHLRGRVHFLTDVIAEHCPEVVKERVAHEIAATARGRHHAQEVSDV